MRGNARFDLSQRHLQSSFMLSLRPDMEEEKENWPHITLIFDGFLMRPKRITDVRALHSYLTVRALEREARRVERIRADILERGRLMREIRRFSEMRQRQKKQRNSVSQNRDGLPLLPQIRPEAVQPHSVRTQPDVKSFSEGQDNLKGRDHLGDFLDQFIPKELNIAPYDKGKLGS